MLRAEKQRAILLFPEICDEIAQLMGLYAIRYDFGAVVFSLFFPFVTSFIKIIIHIWYHFAYLPHAHDNCLQAIKPQFNLIFTILIQLRWLWPKRTGTHFIELKEWLAVIIFKLVLIGFFALVEFFFRFLIWWTLSSSSSSW